MRIQNILAVATAIAASSIACSQGGFEAFTISEELIPKAEIEDAPAGSFFEDVKVQTLTSRLEVRYPFELEDSKTILAPEFTLQHISLSYDNWDITLGGDEVDSLYNFGLGLKFAHSLSSRWRMLASVKGRLDTDFDGVDSDAWGATFGVRFDWKASEATTLGFGAGIQTTFGNTLPLPILRYAFKSDSWFRADVLLPRHAEFWARMSDQIEVGLKAKVNGSQYHLGDGARRANNVRYFNIIAGPAVDVKLAEHFHVSAHGGLTLARRFELYDGDEKLTELNLKNTMFASIAVSYRF